MTYLLGKTLGEAQPTIALASVLTFTCSHDRWLLAMTVFVTMQIGCGLWALWRGRQHGPGASHEPSASVRAA
jgi:hypothetical protein